MIFEKLILYTNILLNSLLMNKLTIPLLIGLMTLCSSFDVLADSQSNTTDNYITIKAGGLKKRPGMPPLLSLDCYYGEGYIGFVFPDDVNTISITISNDFEEWSRCVTSDEPVTETPSFSGEYQIECVADNGHTFIGMIEY